MRLSTKIKTTVKGFLGISRYAKRYIPQAEYYFKISGRYFLNDSFKLENFTNKDGFSFKYYNNSLSTRLYGFSENLFNLWQNKLIYSVPYLMLGYSIEDIFWKQFNNKSVSISTIGLSGAVAPDGALIRE